MTLFFAHLYRASVARQMRRYTNLRGQHFDYSFDADGLLRTIFYPEDQDIALPWTDDEKVLTFPERKAVMYAYDSHKRLIKVTDCAGRETRYKYDIAGRLREIIRHNEYDDLDRSTEIKDRWQTDGRLISLFRLGFNDDSHLTSRFAIPFAYGLAGAPFTATYGDDNRLLTVGGQNVSHDLDGNLLSSPDPLYGGGMNLAYDTRNRLVNATLRNTSSSHTYDAEGVRQSSIFGSQITTYTTSVHGGLSQVLKRQRTDATVTWCVYGLGLLYEVEPDYENLTPAPNSTPLRHTAAEKTLVHHHDQIGNTVAVTDDQQRDVLWVQYDVYGAVVHAESPTQRDGSPPVKPEINEMPDKLDRALAVTPYLFSGQQGVMTDPTGLLYMRARYYHPGLHRFVNPDPIGFEGGSNWYAYAGGNPLMANDPSGLAVRNAGRAVGSAISTGLRSGLDFLIGSNRGRAWGHILGSFSIWNEGIQDKVGEMMRALYSETGIDPQINDNKLGHSMQAHESQKDVGLLGAPLVTLAGILYEIMHMFKPGHVQGGTPSGWGGPAPFFGTFDGQFPVNWLYDTPGELLGNTFGQIGGILRMDTGSWSRGAYLIPGPNYSNGNPWTSPALPGAAILYR